MTRPCALIPVYENPRTVAAVVRGALLHCPVLVVDDGSGAETRAALDALLAEEEARARAAGEEPRLRCVRHEVNQGKGAALRTGWAAAHEAGFTHAVALDADGQHLGEDLPRFLAAASEHPGTLFVGDRGDLAAAGAGAGSVWGRRNSNFWTWVETGLRLPDTQCGFRCYPLAGVNALHLNCTGYDLEVEVLVRASWAGIRLESLPVSVRYFQGDERVSHMRPFKDFVRIGRLNTRLVTMRLCLPAPFLRVLSTRRHSRLPWRRRWLEDLRVLAQEPGSPARVAASVGLGLFMGISPFWGLQMFLTLLLAHVLQLSKPVALLASNVSFPLMTPTILYASLVLGRLALDPPGIRRPLTELDLGPGDFPAWVVGSLLLAVSVACAGALLTWGVMHGVRRLRGLPSS